MSVGSIPNYIKAINSIPLEKGHCRFYRGHSQENWNLNPSLFRPEYKFIKENEANVLRELQIFYPDSFDSCGNLLEKLVVAQHYGIPTRLLDITTNPLIALYFACYNKKPNSGNAKVYIIDVPKANIVYFDNKRMLNKLTSVIDGRDDAVCNETMCIKVRLNNPRIIKQSGAFLLFMASNAPITNLKTDEIIISKSHISKITTDLRQFGCSTESVFPELAQFAYELKSGHINI